MSNADLFDPSAALSGENFTYFRAFIAKQEGIGQSIFGSYDGSVPGFGKLEPDEQIRLTNAMNLWIRNNPQRASAIQQQVAAHGPIELTEKLTLGEKATQLPGVGAAIDTAYEVNKELNPFAFFDSLGKIKWLIIGTVAVVGGVWIYNKVKK